MSVEPFRLGLAFSLGTPTFVAPCAFPLLPDYIAYVLGREHDRSPTTGLLRRAFVVAAVTSLGFLVVFGALAGVVFVAGRQLLQHVSLLELIVGVVLIGLGVAMLMGRQPGAGIHQSLPQRRCDLIGFVGFRVVYTAAAAGCSAPLFVPLVGVALSAGPIGAVVMIGAYAAGMMVLLTLVTVLTALGRETVVRRLVPTTRT